MRKTTEQSGMGYEDESVEWEKIGERDEGSSWWE